MTKTNIHRVRPTTWMLLPVTAATAWWFGSDAVALGEHWGHLGSADWLRLLSDGAVAALAAWLLVSWTLCLLANTPGLAGSVADALARRIAPAAVRRVAVAGIAAGAWLPGSAALAAPVGPGTAVVSVDSAAAGALAELPTPALRAEGQPASGAFVALPSPVLQADDSSHHTVPGSLPAPQLAPDGTTVHPAGHPVVVKQGDTLWDIAATSLGDQATPSRIAVEWPRWFEANRQILNDPDLIYPGQTLTPPTTEQS